MRFTLPPPTRQHAKHANEEASCECDQKQHNERCFPLIAKEEMRSHFMLIVQREGEEGKKNGCLQYPPKQPQDVLHKSL